MVSPKPSVSKSLKADEGTAGSHPSCFAHHFLFHTATPKLRSVIVIVLGRSVCPLVALMLVCLVQGLLLVNLFKQDSFLSAGHAMLKFYQHSHWKRICDFVYLNLRDVRPGTVMHTCCPST